MMDKKRPLVLEPETGMEKMLLEEVEYCQNLLLRIFLSLQVPQVNNRTKEGVIMADFVTVEEELWYYHIEHGLVDESGKSLVKEEGGRTMTKELESIFIRLVRELNIVSDEHYLELYLQENKPPEIAKDIALACFMKRYEDDDTDKVRGYLSNLYWPNTIKG